MTFTEIAGVLVFLFVVVSVFVSAIAILARRLGTRIFRTGVPARRLSWPERSILGAAAFGLLCIAYGREVEPYWPQVVHVTVASPKIAVGGHPIRIVQISDLHSDPKARLERRLGDIIADLHPDFIVFTGDAINSLRGLPVFQSCMRRLAEIAPTYAVRGNWDVWYWGHVDLYRDTGVTELKDGSVLMTNFGTPVFLAGEAVHARRIRIAQPTLGDAAPPAASDFGAALDAAPHDALKVFLYHYPDEIEDVSRHGADLYLAGHTHGGQVALPLYGALVTFSRFGKRFESGLYRVGGTDLYVNRGIGMEGGSIPRVRFLARPEITLIEVVPAGSAPVTALRTEAP